MKEVHFLIDGESCKAPEGENLISAAKRNGTYIPTLCYLEGHESLGTCRVCTIRLQGKSVAACTLSVSEGMELEVNSSELQDMRKALIELLFVEGNHFCPSCEKSGDCELQALGYAMDMRVARYPYRFSPYDVNYQGTKIIMEHNRCVLCKRCTNLYLDDENKRVFSFIGRGSDTRVMLDLEREKSLSQEKLLEAKHLCPVGAILIQGGGFDRPIGTRKFDKAPIGEIPSGD